ncbi:MAG: J domain-containing protein [Microcoleaceae cyanobacterium]
MKQSANHYQTLEVRPTATLAEIKQAYRRLARVFHPDSQSEAANHEQIVQINAAYEVLSDPQRRQSYDRQISSRASASTQRVQTRRRSAKKAGVQLEVELDQWIKKVYRPINRDLDQILKPFKREIDNLAADPFDDELMDEFQAYVSHCRESFEQAQNAFRSVPNPISAASAAAHLYYSLNHVGDGIEELEMFSLNYDDASLHTGQEFFRMANNFRRMAQEELSNVSQQTFRR